MTTVGMEMEPDLWGTLPEDLLHLVFSRLSIAEICRLRLLSKGWKRDIDTIDSKFSRVLEETTYPSMLGLISQDWKDHGEFRGTVFDVKSYRWHDLEIDPAEDHVTTMKAADGGLVCFVSESKKRPLFIVVMNPLTRKKIELPPLLSVDGVVPNLQPIMVQLTMDRQTQQYKVIVAGNLESRKRGPYAQVYDSEVKGWALGGSGEQSWDRVLGCEYWWDVEDESDYYIPQLLGPCVYDFAEGGLRYLNGKSIAPAGEFGVLYAEYGVCFALKDGIAYGPSALWKNRLFVLCRDTVSGSPINYYISEYVLERNATAWVKVGTIRDLPFDDGSVEWCNYSLHACNGFLMISGIKEYFYDLSTCDLQELPNIWGGDEGNDGDTDDDYAVQRHLFQLELMCELRWNAIP